MSEPSNSNSESDDARRKRVLREYRRLGLQRGTTANQIAMFDGLTVVVCIATVALHDRLAVGRWPGLEIFLVKDAPRVVFFAACVMLTARAVLLGLFTGQAGVVGRNLWAAAGRFRKGVEDSIIDKDDDEERQAPVTMPVRSRVSRQEIEQRTKYWYTLIGLGALAQILLVASTGGMAASPFAQILIATYILGQYRAKSIRGITALFWFGIVVAFAAHIAFILLEGMAKEAYDQMHFTGWQFVPAGFLVAFASYYVYKVQVESDALVQDRKKVGRPRLPVSINPEPSS